MLLVVCIASEGWRVDFMLIAHRGSNAKAAISIMHRLESLKVRRKGRSIESLARAPYQRHMY